MLDSKVHWILSGSKLSPFHLKVAAMLKFKGVPYRDFPSEGGFFENISIAFRTQLLKRGLLTLTYPKFTELDEFPLVPFLFGPKGENLFDSSSIAVWLDQNKREANRLNLVTIDGDEAINFLIQLVDDYFDEFGLYMVHHARWKISASDNKAGEYLANELSLVVGPLKPLVAKVFSARQVRRCPYLFSVAPEGYRVEGLSNERQPPSHKDFPETHRLLEQRYLNILTALETIFSTRPYLFGHCFTLADVP